MAITSSARSAPPGRSTLRQIPTGSEVPDMFVPWQYHTAVLAIAPTGIHCPHATRFHPNCADSSSCRHFPLISSPDAKERRSRRGMPREWSAEELIACWTLVEEDWGLLANKTGATRLGFGVILKYFELEAPASRATQVRCLAPPSTTSPTRSRCPPGSSPAMTGRAGPSSTTAPRSARPSGSGRPPSATRTSSPAGWPSRSARWSCPRTGYGRRWWPGAGPSTSSLPPRAGSSGWWARPGPPSTSASPPRSPPV